jgi:hypothetical protein
MRCRASGPLPCRTTTPTRRSSRALALGPLEILGICDRRRELATPILALARRSHDATAWGPRPRSPSPSRRSRSFRSRTSRSRSGPWMAERLAYLPSAGIAPSWPDGLLARWTTRPRVARAVLAVVVLLLACGPWAATPRGRNGLHSLHRGARRFASQRAGSRRARRARAHTRRCPPRHRARAGGAAHLSRLLRRSRRPGQGLVAAGQLAPAAAEIRAAIPLAPRDGPDPRPAPQQPGRRARSERPRTVEAESECREAIQLAPDDLAPRVALIELLRAASRLEEARTELHEAMSVHPSKPVQLSLAGGCGAGPGRSRVRPAVGEPRRAGWSSRYRRISAAPWTLRADRATTACA